MGRRFVFCLFIPVLGAATCDSRPTPQQQRGAVAHYDLGVQQQAKGDCRGALSEYEKAIELDPGLELAHNALGLLLHYCFGRKDEAIVHYKRALEISPKFSEAMVNLGTVYLDMANYDEAIRLFQKALGDILYKTPDIAENNLGWALYKQGKTDDGIQHIRAALVHNPNFCQGWRNLGTIYGEQSHQEKARDAYEHYAKDCPAQCDAHFRLAKVLLSLSDQAAARSSLETCSKSGDGSDCASECRHLLELMK